MKRLILLIVFAVLCMFSAFKVTAQAVNTQDSLALVDLYNATSSAQPWTVHTNWLTTQPVKNWYGVTVVGSRVMRLHLSNNNLTGRLPASLSNLSLLDTLVLSNNNLTDTLPQSFYSFSPIMYVDVSGNKFTFASLQQLGSTFLFSKYYGQAPIPLVTNGNVFSVSAGGTLSNNTYKWFRNDSLFATVQGDSTLTIPVPADNDYTVNVTNSAAPNVVLLSFDSLHYSDSVALVEVLTKLLTYAPDRPDFKSPIGFWHGVTVENNRVVGITTSPNSPLGNLSPAIGKLTRLKTLLVSCPLRDAYEGPTPLTGIIPAEIGNLRRLETLDLSINRLTGPLPPSIGRLTNLSVLNLFDNKISSIPDSMQYLQNLVTLKLGQNGGQNGLTGKLGFLGTLTNLQSCQILYSNIDDSLPPSIGNLVKLQVLDIEYSHLQGSLPASLGNDTLLEYFELNHNNLTGGIPASFGNLKHLQNLDLDNNNLSDTIPASLGTLSTMGYGLQLDHNNLTGAIPASFANLDSLGFLFLNNNKLTGQVPSLVNLHNLYRADISNNQLSGNNIAAVWPKGEGGSKTFDIYDNKFTFDGIEQFNAAENHGWWFGEYAPQLNQPLYRDGNTLYMKAGDLGNDTFRLFKDGTLVNAHLADSAFTITATGTYNIVATNSAVPRLTLYTDSIVVTSLPVTLLNFTAARVKTNVQLNWQTAQEINAANYFVERSINGFDFMGIGTVRATGNTTITQQYSFVDHNAAALNSNNLFYRLKIADKDGSYSYSKIINLQNDGIGNAFIVYPNPVHTSCIVQFTAATAGKYSIALVAADGKVLKRISVAATAGSNRVAINVQDLPQATYLINITGKKDNITLKVVKE